MRCGASRVCITPPVGTELAGFAARQQPSVGVRDDLYAYALYLEQGSEKLLWLHADLIGLDRPRVAALRRVLAAELGLAERQILFSATHTHSGPATLFLRWCGAMDPAYLAALDGYLLAAARSAVATPVEVTLRFAEGQCGLGCDRRAPGPLSHADPALPVLGFVAADGRWVAAVANYAIHNVSLGPDNRHISGDMAGEAARWLAAHLPGEPVVLFTNGGCGNVNPPAESPDFGVMEQFGRRLGRQAVYAATTAWADYPDAGLQSALETVDLPLAVPDRDAVEREYARAVAECAAATTFCQNARRAYDDWRAGTLALLASGHVPRTEAADLQVVRLGPMSLVAIGAEVFSHMAVDLRRACGPQTYVIGYANGDAGYLPPAAVYVEGGYEVEMAYKFYGHFMLAPGAFELLREAAISLLAGLVDNETFVG